MIICYFGNYNPEYARNRILISGLRQNGVDIIECQTRKKGIGKYWSLLKQHNKLKGNYDIMIVGFSGYSVMRLAKWLCRKPLVFDAFVSLYLSDVEDRKLYTENSKAARRLARLDKRACQLADRVLLDTQAQVNYFCQRYSLSKDKFIVIQVGSDDAVIKKESYTLNKEKFIVHWHGHIVPFHGLGVIIKAALKLKPYQDVEFRLITRFNSKYKKIKSLVDSLGLTNIKFFPETSYQGLAQAINQADICLGVFGNNLKAQLVIPNKIYEAIACGKLVVTAKQPAIYEVFQDDINIVTVKPGDPNDLAEKILWVKTNPKLKDSLARNAHELFKLQLTPNIIARKLKKHLELLNDNNIS